MTNNDTQAQILQPSIDLPKDMAFFENLGFRLDNIYPADNPEVAMMSGYGIRIVLDKKTTCPPVTIYLSTDQPEQFDNAEFTAPNGTNFKVKPLSGSLIIFC